jgi:hypothetical protein
MPPIASVEQAKELVRSIRAAKRVDELGGDDENASDVQMHSQRMFPVLLTFDTLTDVAQVLRSAEH